MLDRRTTAVAVGLLVERNPVAAPGLLAPEHLHVVCHRRGWHNGARGHDGRDQHRASLKSSAQALSSAARSLSQHGVKLDRLAALWVQVVLQLFPSPVCLMAG